MRGPPSHELVDVQDPCLKLLNLILGRSWTPWFSWVVLRGGWTRTRLHTHIIMRQFKVAEGVFFCCGRNDSLKSPAATPSLRSDLG